MIYHIKKTWLQKASAAFNENIIKYDYSFKIVIKSVFFFNRLLNSVETRYWLTKLKLIDIIWILKKIRYMIEISWFFIVIYIDHDATLNITKQTSLFIIFTNKFNLRLIRAFDYFQRFNLNIRHKLNKQHIVFDALLKLTSTNITKMLHNEKFFANDELDVFFIAFLIKMNDEFRDKIFNNYQTDFNWQKINAILSIENDAKLLFYRKNDLIYLSNDFIIEFHVYESRRLCISHSIIENILKMIHDENHLNFVRCYEKIIVFYYIRDFSRYFKDYFKHCPKCLIFQIRRHQSYDFLQFILISSISFHIITINLILTLSLSAIDDFDIFMSIICKFFKRVILISNNVK